MRVGVVQIRGRAGASEGEARDRLRALSADRIADLFSRGARLVVLPECALHDYFPRTVEEVGAFAETLPGPTVRAWQSVARAHGGYVVGGLIERDGDDLFNTAVVVGPQGLIGRYRKIHRFGWERRWLKAGEAPLLVDIPSLGLRLGVLVCYDLRFPEAVRALAFAGMDVLAVPTAWTSIGKRTLWDRGGYCPQDHVAIAHAYQNRVAVVCADRVGAEAGVRFLGASIAVAAGGEVALGPLAGEEEALAVVDLDPAQSRDKTVADAGDLWADRRPTYAVERVRIEEEG